MSRIVGCLAALALSVGAVTPTIGRAQTIPPAITTSASIADTSAPLVFPAPTPWGSYKPKSKYDKFADSTRVAMSIMTAASAPKGFMGLQGISPEVHVTFGYSFAGTTQRDTVHSVALLVTSSKDFSHHDDVKATIQAAHTAPLILILGDGSRLHMDATLLDSDVDVYGWSEDATKTSVVYGTAVPIRTYLQIINSAKNVQGRVGETEFELDKRALDALRNFAGHMGQVAPGLH